MIALQHMLLQQHEERVFLLPAWPLEWDVEFKLHASHGEVIEGCWRAGQWHKRESTKSDRLKN